MHQNPAEIKPNPAKIQAKSSQNPAKIKPNPNQSKPNPAKIKSKPKSNQIQIKINSKSRQNLTSNQIKSKAKIQGNPREIQKSYEEILKSWDPRTSVVPSLPTARVPRKGSPWSLWERSPQKGQEDGFPTGAERSGAGGRPRNYEGSPRIYRLP